MTVTIRPASVDDFSAAIELLQCAGLPIEDLTTDRLALVAEKDGELLGVVGVENFGSTALLRSLVVSKNARGAGIGPTLVKALESSSAADGVAELWLLTIDADAFFQKHGYVVQPRDAAPNDIRTTEEFSDLCPGDAVLMKKRL